MAANEHKNLSDINRHDPRFFEVSTNQTVCSKDFGSSENGTDGNLVWQKKSLMGSTNYRIQGYTTSGTSNYAYGEDIQDNKSPFQMDVDFGSDTVASGTITPQNFFKIGQGFAIPENSTVNSITGWLTNNQGTVVTIALCKITPVEGVTTAVTPIVVDEIAVTGLTSNSKGVRINETTITTPSLAAGDILFPMIKQVGSGSVIHLTLTVQTTTF
tara:strand:- start:630 stop:1271 length:642 start_codon:yes stop_codon:yes gene_type:complete